MNTKRRYLGELGGEEVKIVSTKPETHMDAVFAIANEQLAQLDEQSHTLTQEQKLMLLAINAISDQLEMQTKLNGGA